MSVMGRPLPCLCGSRSLVRVGRPGRYAFTCRACGMRGVGRNREDAMNGGYMLVNAFSAATVERLLELEQPKPLSKSKQVAAVRRGAYAAFEKLRKG